MVLVKQLERQVVRVVDFGEIIGITLRVTGLYSFGSSFCALPLLPLALGGKSHLLGLLRLSVQDPTGHWKADGRPCVGLSRASAGRLLHCQREKAAGLFAALERCGLLESVPGQSNGKARRYYLNLPRPKEPNEL